MRGDRLGNVAKSVELLWAEDVGEAVPHRGRMASRQQDFFWPLIAWLGAAASIAAMPASVSTTLKLRPSSAHASRRTVPRASMRPS